MMMNIQSTPPLTSSRTKIISTATASFLDLAQNASSATDTQLTAAVDALIASGPKTPTPGPATLKSGAGHWDVIHAPHINRIASFLHAKFSISYTLLPPSQQTSGDKTPPPQFYSNVKYQIPGIGEGWLSASGSLISQGDDDVEVRFNQFWVDTGKDSLRPYLTEQNRNGGDAAVTALGRASFFEGLAVFPVLHLDTDAGVSVFRFPPLSSNIAVVRR